MRMGLSSSIGAQYGAAFRIDHIVDPPTVRGRPAHAIGGTAVELLKAGVESAAGTAPTDRLDGLAERHEAPLPHTLAHLVLLRAPAGAEGIAFPAGRARRRSAGRLRLTAKRLRLRRAPEGLRLRPAIGLRSGAPRLRITTPAVAGSPALRAHRRGKGRQHEAGDKGGHRFHKPFLGPAPLNRA